MMLIPHQQLSNDALLGVIEEFVTRDGTDYGEFETPLAVKVDHVKLQLDHGVLVIIFNEDEESIAIVPRKQLPPSLVKS